MQPPTLPQKTLPVQDFLSLENPGIHWQRNEPYPSDKQQGEITTFAWPKKQNTESKLIYRKNRKNFWAVVHF